MDIILTNFSYKKLNEIVAEFADKYEYDMPIVNIDVRNNMLTIRVHLYNSPLHGSFSFNYGVYINHFSYELFIQALEESFKKSYDKEEDNNEE